MKRYPSTVVAVVVGAAMAACGGGSEKHQTTGPEVVVKNLAFKPSRMSVKVGDSVTWTFEDKGIVHNVTADDGSFKSQDLSKGTFVHTFAAPGSVSYTCTIHPDKMKGTVNVRA